MKNKAKRLSVITLQGAIKVNIAIVILEKWNIAASLNVKEYYFHLPREKNYLLNIKVDNAIHSLQNKGMILYSLINLLKNIEHKNLN